MVFYQGRGDFTRYVRNWNMGLYYQDEWRIKSRFAINYGMRYEIINPNTETRNRLNAFYCRRAVARDAERTDRRGLPGRPWSRERNSAELLQGVQYVSLVWLTPHLTHFYLAYFLIGLVGNGTAYLGYPRAISAWFNRRRGMDQLTTGFAAVPVGAKVKVAQVLQ